MEVTAPEPTREPPVDLRGVVTVNGERIDRAIDPEELGEMVTNPTGHLEFECLDEACDSPGANLDDGIYEASINPGGYRVVYKPPTRYLDGQTTAVADTIAGVDYVLDPEFVVREPGRRDFDMKALRVEGRVTVEGESPESAERGSGSADPEHVGEVSMIHYWRELDEGYAGMCPSWAQSVNQRLTVGGEASTWRFWAFPGHYRIKTELHRGGGRVERAVELADEHMDFERDLPMTEVAGRIVREGQPLDEQEIREREVIASTATGRVDLPVAADGTFSGRVVGQGPRVVYKHRNDLRAKPSERPAPDGSVVLRDGCAR